MASWKKVIVSGSSAALQQLSVDTNITASGNISSSGNIVASDLTLSGDISVTQITASIISASSTLVAGTTTLSGTTVSTLKNDSAVGSSHLTGSFSGSFKGEYLNSDGTALTAEWDGTRNGNSQITGSGAGPSLVLSGSTGDDLEVKKNAKVGGKILATDFDTITSGDVILFDTVGDNDLTIGATTTTVKLVGDLIELGNGTGDVVDIKGDLNVAGTASFTSANNLAVADKYILLNSGSAAAGDGGIVIQQATNGIGELFGFDSSANRFGITGSFNADTSADFAPDAFMSMVVSGSAGQNTPDVAPARYQQAGNIFAAANGDIYIYGNE
jgi:hypothetical protein